MMAGRDRKREASKQAQLTRPNNKKKRKRSGGEKIKEEDVIAGGDFRDFIIFF